MIQINNNLETTVCQLYDNNDNLVGDIKNSEALTDVMIQLYDQQLKGYYIMFNDRKLTFNERYELSDWPNNFFDISQKLYVKLFRLRHPNKTNQK